MCRRCRSAIALLLAVLFLTAADPATGQTGPLLRAPHVRSRVRIQWDPALRRIVAAVDDDAAFHSLTDAPPFLTDGGVVVTYPRLNPLRISVTITPRDGAVPADTVLARLRGLMTFAAMAVPSQDTSSPPVNRASVGESCPALTTARADAGALAARLAVTPGSSTVAALVGSWRQAIDDGFQAGRNGPDAVSAAVTRMDAFVAQLDAQLGDADRLLSRIDAATRVAPANECDASAHPTYEAMNLANPRGRLAELTSVRATVAGLRDALSRTYLSDATRWQGPEYRLDAPIRPPKQAADTVTVRVTRLDFEVDQSSGALIAVEEHSGSETVAVQRFSRFTPEFAVATMFGSVTTPGYGTTTNDHGVTVVDPLPKPIASVGPAFLASFVCRCQTGPLIAPMLQVGLATSNDKPALLGGGGIRLFGLPKGDVALGAGGMIAWVKDLHTLRVGDPVGGTSDIQFDLHYVHRAGYYLALQYKF